MPTAFAQTPQVQPPPTAAQVQDAAGLLPPSLTAWWLVALVGAVVAWWFGPQQPYQPRVSAATFDLERDLPKAKASVRQRDAVKPCSWRSGDQRFACGDEPWAFVGPYGGITAGVARRCTWAHPVAAGATAELRWEKAAVGRELQVQLGLVDAAPAGAPVHLKVWLGADLMAELQSRDASDFAQLVKEIPVGEGRADLRLEISTTDHTLRMACLDVRMRGERPGGVAHPEAR